MTRALTIRFRLGEFDARDPLRVLHHLRRDGPFGLLRRCRDRGALESTGADPDGSHRGQQIAARDF